MTTPTAPRTASPLPLLAVGGDRPCRGLHEQIVRIWAQALYFSPLRPADRPNPEAVCQAVVEQLAVYSRVPGGCADVLAQDAGDYPAAFRDRYTWCRNCADRAYSALLLTLPPQPVGGAFGMSA
ncbi:hypothetical protein AB0D08_11645 [Kitasatospora sp. NPDC048540]|uniref:hypothetical protein n=1 Tax=Kitasatospora sp. NPDC048540 TaxID=3155634 RepID=UPI0033C07D12